MSRFNSHMRTWLGACIAGLRVPFIRLAAERSVIRHPHPSPGDRDLLEDPLPLQPIGLCGAALLVFVSLAMLADRSATAAIAHPQPQQLAPAADADTPSGEPGRKCTRAS
jgi:hypothetical protein